jgi:AbiJ N-terminal domain 3/Protein of unknown function (DUF559)
MKLLESLRAEIAYVLSSKVKAHTLASVCSELGLDPGEDSEAWQSKFNYVMRRLKPLQREHVILLAQQVLDRYPAYDLEEKLELIHPSVEGVISAITRRNIIDELNTMEDLAGKLHRGEFLNRVFPLEQMQELVVSGLPGTFEAALARPDPFGRTLQECVVQHMLRNDDWSYRDFFEQARFLEMSERRFRMLLEAIVHPEVRTGSEQEQFVNVINGHLVRDGFELRAVGQTSGYVLYRVVRRGGVLGLAKNLIFAANGPKPELVLQDAVNNDIRIVKNQSFCLVYDRPIELEGLRWNELVKWWAELAERGEDAERSLYKRLMASLASEPERKLFRFYFECFRDKYKETLPALIPQVYLHYDPYTVREIPSGSELARQRMDFLMLLPYRQRVVIEIDGQHHYAEDEKPSPKRYAEMVAEDRSLRLQGYEVFRFGGFEFTKNPREVVTCFFQRLLKR